MPDEAADSGATDAPLTEGSKPTQDAPKATFGGSKKGRKIRQPTELLRDMRWAYKHPRVEGETLTMTPGQQQCRELQEKDQVEFLKMLRDLEKAHLMAHKKKDGGGPSPNQLTTSGTAPTDPREENVLSLIAELRAKMKAE